MRILGQESRLKAAICWMLTCNDGRKDGKHTSYLRQEAKWRALDPPLFDHLRAAVHSQKERGVTCLHDSDLLPDCIFYDRILEDDRTVQETYFENLETKLQRADYVFFDPDNGLQVKSTSLGRKNSSKYLYWKFLVPIYKSGKSVLIYQHFPRLKRKKFIRERMKEIQERTGSYAMVAIETPYTIFFLAAHEYHKTKFQKGLDAIKKKWVSDKIVVHQCDFV